MDIMGALTMAGHKSGSTKQFKSCGNINIKSRTERIDGCLLRQKKREKKVQTLAGVENAGTHYKKNEKKIIVEVVWAQCLLVPTPTPDRQAS